jgi:hypothetical protein
MRTDDAAQLRELLLVEQLTQLPLQRAPACFA